MWFIVFYLLLIRHLLVSVNSKSIGLRGTFLVRIEKNYQLFSIFLLRIVYNILVYQWY